MFSTAKITEFLYLGETIMQNFLRTFCLFICICAFFTSYQNSMLTKENLKYNFYPTM